MRRVFLRSLAVGPADYRRRFQPRPIGLRPSPREAATDQHQGDIAMDIAILLFDRFTALDAIGPYEVLSRVPGARVTFVAAQAGPVQHRQPDADDRSPSARSPSCAHPDVVLVPGGPGEVDARAGEETLQWLRDADETSTWTTSVCTGSLILAAAGLLAGRRATSHWLALERARRARRHGRPRAGRLRRQDRHRRRRLRRHRHGARARRASLPAWRSPRRSSSASSTTRSHPSTPARPRRLPPRSSTPCARSRFAAAPAG